MAIRDTILDEVLPCLADEFEAGNRKFQWFKPSSVEEREPLRACLATLIAEGSLIDFEKAGVGAYRFTPAGYKKYKLRVDALRLLPRKSDA